MARIARCHCALDGHAKVHIDAVDDPVGSSRGIVDCYRISMSIRRGTYCRAIVVV